MNTNARLHVARAIACSLALLPVVTAELLAGQGAGPSSGRYVSSRTEWGDPDLQGVFSNSDENGIPFERPSEFEGRQLADVTGVELARVNEERQRTALERAPVLENIPGIHSPLEWFEHFGADNSRAWLVVDPPDGRVPPLTAEARERTAAPGEGGGSFMGGPFDGPEDFSLYDRCITRGVPGSMMPAIYGNAYQIVQSPGFVAIRYEMIHEARVIPLGSPHLSGRIRPYMGDARGHWDGETLVVETTNFRRGSAFQGGNSETFRLIERFTRVAGDKVEWAVTVDDPTTWVRPWTFAMHLTQKDASQQPFEYACHEGNRGLANMLTISRAGK